MARLPRLSVAEVPHLVVQRGAHGASIFRSDTDRQRFLADLVAACRDAQLALHGFALLPDAAYLLVTPADTAATGLGLQALGRRYVRWFNDRYARRGALFDGRFRSTVLSPDEYFLAALRYVESRPLAGGLVASPEQFRWSSYRHHAGLEIDSALSDHELYWALGNTPFERQARWRDYIAAGPGSAEVETFSRALLGGWALGTDEFLRNVAVASGRRSQKALPGRPRKRSDSRQSEQKDSSSTGRRMVGKQGG